MKHILKFSVVIVLLGSLLLFASCSLFENDGSGHTFKISISTNPENLDPQIANDHSSIAVAKNMFVGLMRSVDGRLTAGVAENYLISDDGLKYTFTLDKRYKWKSLDGFSADLTAHDFVFAFKRLFDAETASPHAQKYYCILNSAAAHNGAKPLDEIGVKALDDYTLEFTLAYPNADFLYLLAELPASPCNEEFFDSCKGKYGLEAENIASNGAFYVRYWLYDKYNKSNYIRLSKNNFYNDIKRVYPSGVTYFIHASSSDKLNSFTSETTDILIDKGRYPTLNEADYEYSTHYSETYGFVFNSDNEIFSKKEVKELFSIAIDREGISSLSDKRFVGAYGIIPPETVVCGSLFESDIDKKIMEHNKITAEYRWSFVLSDEEKDSLLNKNILVCDTFACADILQNISNSWYDAFGIHFGIEFVNESDYNKRIDAGEYDIALVALSAKNGDTLGYLSDFGRTDKYGYSLDEIKFIESAVGKYNTLTAKYSDIVSAERKIVEEYFFLPVCYSTVRCYYNEDIADFKYDALTDVIYFEEAKAY